MNATEALPLIFNFGEEVFASDFAARIAVRGRALVIKDDEDVSILGLDPSGASGGGEDLGAAWRGFRSNFKKTIEDVVSMTDSYESFKRTFFDLLGKAPAHMESQWDEALRRVKSKTPAELELKIVPNYEPRGIEIHLLSHDLSEDETIFALAA